MTTFRNRKKNLLDRLARTDWRRTVYHALDTPDKGREAVNPLLAMLPRPEVQWQAAVCLGRAVALLAQADKEAGRNIMRRLMWSLNEESGNLGWGIPQAMGCIVAESPALAKEFGRILVSYIIDTGKDDNFLDHAPLRMGAYWGIGRACASMEYSLFSQVALPRLVAGLKDEDAPCRAMVAWALGKTAETAQEEGSSLSLEDGVLLSRAIGALKADLADDKEKNDATLPLLEGDTVLDVPVRKIRTNALEKLRAARDSI